jgi:hypothetical protein
MTHVWKVGRCAFVASCASIGAAGLASVVVAQEVDARARIVTLAPSGGDDTSHLQAALDRCAALGAGCTVRLEAGTFYVGQIVSRGFDGVLAGAGHDVTVIERLPSPDVHPFHEGVTTAAGAVTWPSTLTFIDASLMMVALSVRVPIVHFHGARPAAADAPGSGAETRRVGGGRCAGTGLEPRLDDGNVLASGCD